MFRQFQYNTKEVYEKAIQEAIGSDNESFERKRVQLFKRWCENPSYPNVESRLMARIVSKELSPNPVDCAFISDNLEFFQTKYAVLYGQKLELALQIACLCGAKKISSFLLEALKTDFTNPKMHYLLEYIMTSDLEWAKEVAHKMIKTGQKDMPKGISAFPTMEEYLQIQDLFSSKKIEEKIEKYDEKKVIIEKKQETSSIKAGKSLK